MKWEYKVARFTVKNWAQSHDEEEKGIVAQLNGHGRQGWELVETQRWMAGLHMSDLVVRCTFKRPIPEGQ